MTRASVAWPDEHALIFFRYQRSTRARSGDESRSARCARLTGSPGSARREERLDRLLAAKRRADEDARRVGDAASQPVGHPLGMALPLRRQRPLHVVLALVRLFGLGMAPQDEVHHASPMWRPQRACARTLAAN